MRTDEMKAETTAQHMEQILVALPGVPIVMFWDRAPWHSGQPIRDVLDANPRLQIIRYPVAAPDQTRPPFWVYDAANRHLFFSSYHMSPRNLPHYVAALATFQPVAIAGYPSSLYLLARAQRAAGTRKVHPTAIYAFSECLLDFQRELIEDVFRCRALNWYGNTEMCANIVECEEGELHLKLEHSFVEVLNDDNLEAGPGKCGRLVCTGFGNRAFPLIRYEIGDEVRMSEHQESRCGRGGLLVDEVIGRTEDYIVTPDGRFVGRLDHIFKDTLTVREAQLVQDDIQRIVIRIVPDEHYSTDDERALIDAARLRLGPNIRIDVERAQSIARSAGGKFRFVVSSLDQEAILEGLAP